MYNITVNITCSEDNSLRVLIYGVILGGVVLVASCAIITLAILVRKRKVRQISKKRDDSPSQREENKSCNMEMNSLRINNIYSQKASSNNGKGKTSNIHTTTAATTQMPQVGHNSAAVDLRSASAAENMRSHSFAASQEPDSDKIGANFESRRVSAEVRDNLDSVAKTMGRNAATTRIQDKFGTATLPVASPLAKISGNSTAAKISHEFSEACHIRFKEKSAKDRDSEKISRNVSKGNNTCQTETEADLEIYYEIYDTARDSDVERDKQEDNCSITYMDPQEVSGGYHEEFGSEDDYSHTNDHIRRVPSNLETYSTMQSDDTYVKYS